MERFVRDGWAARDCRVQKSLERRLDREPRFATEADYFGPGEQDRDPVFTEFLWPNGLGHSATLMVSLAHGDPVIIRFKRERCKGPFPPEALEALDRLEPHFRRAAAIGTHFSRQQERSALAAYDSIGLAAVTLAASGHIVDANGEFASETSAWNPVEGGRFSVADAAADNMLQAALQIVGQTQRPRSIPLRDAMERVRATIHLLPLRRGQNELFGRASAIAVLTRSEPDRRPAPSLLQALFGLTPSEANIASRIVAGHTVEEMAEADSRSELTIRNQIKSILGKTGCRRQLDLVRLVVDLVPPGI